MSTATLALLSLLRGAGAPAVAVDWSQVPDAIVERCQLGGLKTMVPHTLLEAGFALVKEPGPGDIQVFIRSVRRSFVIEGSCGAARERERVAIGARCDSTVLSDLARDTLGVVSRLAETCTATPAATTPEPPQPPPDVSEVVVEPQPAEPARAAKWQVTATLGAIVPGAKRPLPQVATRLLRRGVSAAWGVEASVSAFPYGGVWLVEPGAALTGTLLLGSSNVGEWYAGASGGVLGHFAFSGARQVGHAEAFGSVSIEWVSSPWVVRLAAIARNARTRHTEDGKLLYRSERFGAALAVGSTWDL